MYYITVADEESYVEIPSYAFEEIIDEYRNAGYVIEHVLKVIDAEETCSVVYFAKKPGSINKEIGYLYCKY